MKGQGVRRNAGRGILGMLLVMALFLSTVIPSYADEVQKITITDLKELTTSYEVESGTSREDAVKKLPEKVIGIYKGEDDTDKEEEVSVSWNCGDYEAENTTDKDIAYTFEAALTDEAVEKYTLANDVKLPTVTCSVKAANNNLQDSNAVTLGDVDKVTVSDGKAFVKSTGKEYDSLDAAMEAAAIGGDTIYLGKGVYCGNSENPTVKGKGAGKRLTFVGAGIGETTWQVRAPESQYGSDGFCDYSFDGSDSITFESMTIIGSVYPDGTPKANDTQGFVRISNVTLKNCTFNGRADYWGYKTTTFENVTFNAPGTKASGVGDMNYSLWTYTGAEYTFKKCTFNSAGKTVNVYRHNAEKENAHNVTVNFEDCKVNAPDGKKKTVLKINDNTMGDYKYIINISGTNVISGSVVDGEKVSDIDTNGITCSRLFGFDEAGENSGRTDVYISGTKVWENGNRVGGHDQDLAGEGSYDDGKADGTKLQYTDGYKDNAFDYSYKINGDWVKADEAPGNGWVDGVREVKKVCRYCGYSEEYTEKQSTQEKESQSEEKKTYTESTEQAAPIVSTTNVAVGKVWQDDDNRDGIRPASVTVQLYRNGEPYGNPVTLSEENSWWYRWDYLDEQSSWTVDELNVADGYTKSITKNAVNAWVIVNTHTPETQTVVPTDTSAPAQNQNLTGRGAGTGDESNMLLWLALMVVTGAGAAAGFVAYRRRKY